MTLRHGIETHKQHLKHLRLRAWLFISLPLLFFVVGVAQYWGDGYTESRLGILKDWEGMWVPLLFLLPIAAQMLTILVLHSESRRDHSVAAFYNFCLQVMTLCPLGYCLLWSIYPLYGGQWFSILALVGVSALLLVVGFMTYAIIRIPRNSSALLSEDDIGDVAELCQKLKEGSIDKYRKVYEVFGTLNKNKDGVNPVVEMVEKIAVAETTSNDQKTKFVEVVNQHVIVNKDFHVTFIDANEENEEIQGLLNDKREGLLNDRRWERWNRLILDDHLQGHVGKTKNRYLWWVEHLLNDLHEGVAKTPFWAVMFFFTVFLGITYLFAFAFAFHDRSAKLASGGVPALFMARDRPSDAVEEPALAPPAAPTWPDYVLHYTGGEGAAENTVPAGSTAQFDEVGYAGFLKEKSELAEKKRTLEAERKDLDKRKAELVNRSNDLKTQRSQPWLAGNYQAAFALDAQLKAADGLLKTHAEVEKRNTDDLKQVEAELTKKNAALQEHIDRWKQNRNQEHLDHMLGAVKAETSYGEGVLIELKGGARDGDAAKLEERRVKLKHLMMTRLAEARAIPLSLSWMDLPEEALSVSQPRGEPSLEQLLSDGRRHRLVELVNTKLGKTHADTLGERLDKLSNSAGADNPKLRGDLQRLLGFALPEDSPLAKEKNYTAKLSHALDEFGETYNSRRLFPSGEAGGGEYIAVSVKPLQKPHHAIPLGLMDYVYFTVYTITTTGYGDIVPTTTYAKFLCTFANIVEVFFLVVFFNALLGVRGGQKFGAAG